MANMTPVEIAAEIRAAKFNTGTTMGNATDTALEAAAMLAETGLVSVKALDAGFVAMMCDYDDGPAAYVASVLGVVNDIAEHRAANAE